MSNFIRRSSSTPLNVNTNPNRHYMTEKTEDQGIKDLQALAKKSEQTKRAEVEEVWIYVCGKDGSNRTREFWFEVGSDETPNQAATEPTELDIIVNFLKNRGIHVDRWAHYHYHPMVKAKSEYIQAGSLFPSDGDIVGIVDKYSQWTDYNLGGTYSNAVVTKHGVWRTKWTGPNLSGDSPKISEYQKLLAGQAVNAFRSLMFWAQFGAGPSGPTRGFYKRFSQHFSTPWTKTRFQPIDINKIPEGKIYPRLGSLNGHVKTANPENYFQKLFQQMAKDNEKLSGDKLEIQWDDSETIVSVVPDKNGGRRVYFNFVIDTNNDPTDGRIYMEDIYGFDETNKYIGSTRDFIYKPHLPNAKSSLKMATRYAQTVGDPTLDQRRAFAQQVARLYLNL